MEFVIIWLICGIISAIIGSKKGAGCSGFIIGILLGPFGIIIALITKGNRRTCPYCKELINKEAIVCPRCQRDISNNINNKPTSFIDGIKKGMQD
jgi:hypothetical protein